jgi:enediyne biosynthesis protein E4
MFLLSFMAWVMVWLAASAQPAAPTPPQVTFTDVASQSGLNFVNVSGGLKTKRYLLETTGNGLAWIDYDRDGYPDLFLVNGTTIEGFPPGQEPTNRLYHNNGDGTFTDVTVKAGLTHSGWGQGACVGDYDNDGWDDIFVTYFGRNLLYHNNGDGTFSEAAERAGVAGDDQRWNTGCAFVDYDRDGNLDLFVATYVDQGPDFRLLPQPGNGQFCQYKGIPTACGPRGLKSGRNYLYHNDGHGAFTDVSGPSGILLKRTVYALGVVTLDYDNDGWPDLYVASDSTASILYHNNHDGTFTDLAELTGVAFSGEGETQGGMAVAAADYDGDGFLDLAKTNFSDDTPDLYHNNGDGTFSDLTFAAGLGGHPEVMGYGIGFLDFDNDGWKDLFIANGHVSPELDAYHINVTYAEPKLLYWNVPAPGGGRKFIEVSKSSGPGICILSSSRGAALADYDNDGDIDIAINNMNAPPNLLRNDGGNRQHWIEIRTIGVKSNRDGVGTRVEVRTGGHKQVDDVRSGGSWMSQNDMRLHFGLGDTLKIDGITLRWPSGQVDILRGITSDQIIFVKEGKGWLAWRPGLAARPGSRDSLQRLKEPVF